MKVLLVKMSSMGDVFHTFPALSDALKNIPNLQVDWIVEASFAEIPSWHPAVKNVYAIELRKWRKSPFKNRRLIKDFFKKINTANYDLVIDAQGLLKSAWVVGKINCAKKAGYNWSSAREPLASLWYSHTVVGVDKEQHAIWRIRELFQQTLGYAKPSKEEVDYSLATDNWKRLEIDKVLSPEEKYAVFLHGTTWDTKYWPESYWIELANKVSAQGIKVILPWGNEEEKQRAERIASKITPPTSSVPTKMLSLTEMARCLKFAEFVVSIDTGLSHVAAALDVKMVVLYRVTDPVKIGAMGSKVSQLVSPEAHNYLRKFQSTEQGNNSLLNLQVADVLDALRLNYE